MEKGRGKKRKKGGKQKEKGEEESKSGQDSCKLLVARAAARLYNANSVLAVHKSACPERLVEKGRQCRALAFRFTGCSQVETV